MNRRPPRFTRTDTLFPYTTLFRSYGGTNLAHRHTSTIPTLARALCRDPRGTPVSHAFLSDPWFDAVEELRSEQHDAPDAMADATIHITVTGGPDGDVDVHPAGGAFARGHTEGAPTRITVPNAVAKKLFIDGDQSATMQRFMPSQKKVERKDVGEG